ncbi:hypothetical protein CEB3_c13410 [Peptococcaceae bacterium CEB3]|nr:hypothetical protein CEB3_c13410 [Peptococcaceae bacterium CEB3]
MQNPFAVGDTVVTTWGWTVTAFQIVKTTAKTVTIQQIRVNNGKPVRDAFITDKQERHSIKLDHSGKIAVNWHYQYLYKYIFYKYIF